MTTNYSIQLHSYFPDNLKLCIWELYLQYRSYLISWLFKDGWDRSSRRGDFGRRAGASFCWHIAWRCRRFSWRKSRSPSRRRRPFCFRATKVVNSQIKMDFSKSLLFLVLLGVAFADDDAAAPTADLDARAQLLVSKQVAKSILWSYTILHPASLDAWDWFALRTNKLKLVITCAQVLDGAYTKE